MVKERDYKIIGFDTETEQYVVNGSSYNWLMSIQLYDGERIELIKSDFSIYEYKQHYLTPDEIVVDNRKRMSVRFMEVLAEMVSPDKQNMLYALNLNFDASQIAVLSDNALGKVQLDGLDMKDKRGKASTLSNAGKILGGEIYPVLPGTNKAVKVLIRDVGRFFMGGLDAIAKQVLGKSKYTEPNLLKSYPFSDLKTFNEWWNVTLFGNYEYATRDAIITQEVGVVVARVYGESMTISSASMKEFVDEYNDLTGASNDLFWPTLLNEHIYETAKAAASGGLTLSPYNEYAREYGKPERMLFKNVVKLDITSAYPTAMMRVQYPKPYVQKTYYFTSLKALKKHVDQSDFYLLAEFTDLTMTYAQGKMTDLVKTSRLGAAKPYFRILEPMNMALNNLTLRRFLKRADDIHFAGVTVYEFAYDLIATRVMQRYVKRNFELKAQGKREGNKIKELEGKSKLNNLSGKFNQHIWEDEFLIDNELKRDEHDFSKDKHWFNPLVYAEITAFTRGQMTDTIEKLGIERVLQVDTDSLKIFVENDDELNKYKQVLRELNDEYEDPLTGLGHTKEEGYFSEYMTLQRKVHGGRAISEEGTPTTMRDFEGNGQHHWAHAGMRNEAFDKIVNMFTDNPTKLYNYMLTEPEYEGVFARRGKYGVVVLKGMKRVKSFVDLTDVIEQVKRGGDFKLIVSKLRRDYNMVFNNGSEDELNGQV